jgi:4-amino-4-deoxy-L-arabinose transferase-like glycosyltransferase
MTTRSLHALRSPAMWAPLSMLALAVLTGVVARVIVLRSPIGRMDGDEGVTGVMALRILDGQFPAFFGNQNYQGALEQYLQAGALALLPDSPFTLRIVQVALMAAAIVLTYLLATRVTGSRWGGMLAAWLMAVGPYYLVVKGVKSHGGYDGAMVAGLVMILLALALRRGSPRDRWMAVGIGVAGGIALWENPTALYLVIPAVVWALGSARGALARLLPWGLLGALVGLLPWIIHAFSTGSLTPSRSGAQPSTTFIGRLRALADPVLPDFLGLSNASPAIAPGLPSRAIVLVIAALGAMWYRRRGIVSLITLRPNRRKPIDLVLLAFIITPFLYAASPFTWYIAEPRYLFTLYPLVAVAAAAGVMAIRVPQMRMAAGISAVIGSAFLLGTSIDGAIRANGWLNAAKIGGFFNEDLPLVAEVLERRGVAAAYGNFWLAGPLQFSTGGAVPVAAGLWTQFPDTERAVASASRTAVVVPTEPGAMMVRQALDSTGRTYRAIPAGRFTVFTDITPTWRPAANSFVFFPA